MAIRRKIAGVEGKFVGIGTGKEGEKTVEPGGGLPDTLPKPTFANNDSSKTVTERFGYDVTPTDTQPTAPSVVTPTNINTGAPTTTPKVNTPTTNNSVYNAGDKGHDVSDSLYGLTKNTDTGKVYSPTGANVTGVQLRDWKTDTTDWLKAMANATNAVEWNQYKEAYELQSKAQGRDISNGAYTKVGGNFLTAFKDSDGTIKQGYYGVDENGNYGYFADAAHTQKIAGTFDVKPGTLGWLKQTDLAAYYKALGKTSCERPYVGEPVSWQNLATGESGTGAPPGYNPNGTTTAERLGGVYGPQSVLPDYGSGKWTGGVTGGFNPGTVISPGTVVSPGTGIGTGTGTGGAGGSGGSGGGTGSGGGWAGSSAWLQGYYQQLLDQLIGQGGAGSSGSYAASDKLVEQLKALYGGEGGLYANALAAQTSAQDEATRRAVEALERQSGELDSEYSRLGRQLYLESMNSRRDIDQELAYKGLNGGAAESVRLELATSYSEALHALEQERIGKRADIARAIDEAVYNGEMSNAKAAAENARAQTDSYAEMLRELLSREDRLAAQREENDREDSRQLWNRIYQLGRDAVGDARYNDEQSYREWRDSVNDSRYSDELSWDRQYKLSRDAIADSRYQNEWAYRMSSDEFNRQLAQQQLMYAQQQYANELAMQQAKFSYTQQQDAYSLALQQAQLGAKLGDYSGYAGLGYNVSAMTPAASYTPTFTVAQVQKELENARKFGTQLSPTVLADYEYYYGSAYGTSQSYTGSYPSASAGGSVGYNNGSLSSGQVKTLQARFGLSQDGYWGPDSQKKTGFSSAAEALEWYGKLSTTASFSDLKRTMSGLIAQGSEARAWAIMNANLNRFNEKQKKELYALFT